VTVMTTWMRTVKEGIMDTLAAGEHRGLKAGKLVVLSKNFSGSDRDVQCRFMDAMSLVAKYGKPDYFLIMTCNPYWPEITELLLPGQTHQDRPDIVTRVYHAKLIDFHDFVIKKGFFGKVAAWAHVTEFQKRGLSHEHFLLIMDSSSKLSGPDDFDKYISAELLDEKKCPLLHEFVCKHMMHGPCGVLNRNCGCMQDGACRFRYPKQFSETTEQEKNAYPIYRRRNDGHKVFVRKKWLDNRWVVPYNPTLLMRYNCHINVEVSSSIKGCKYLYKYVFSDLAMNCTSISYMPERAILSTRNEYVDSLNAVMIGKFPENENVYYSHDSVDDDSTNNYPLNFLNSITPNCLPPHELKINVQ